MMDIGEQRVCLLHSATDMSWCISVYMLQLCLKNSGVKTLPYWANCDQRRTTRSPSFTLLFYVRKSWSPSTTRQKLPFFCSILCILSISTLIRQAPVCLIFISIHKLSLQYLLLNAVSFLKHPLPQRVRGEAIFSIPLHLTELPLATCTIDGGGQGLLKFFRALLRSEMILGITFLFPLYYFY